MFIFGKKRNRNGRFGYSRYGERNRFGIVRNKRRSKMKKIAATFLLSVSIYVVFFSEYFEFKDISIENNTGIEEVILRNSINDKLSLKIFGIIPSNNILLFDSNGMVSYLEENNPTIESIQVSRRSYDSIAFVFNEKKSLLIWCRLNDCFYIDDNGVAFKNAKNELSMNIVPIKIYEQAIIEEEAGDRTADTDQETQSKNDTEVDQKNAAEPKILSPININDKVSDKEFLDFLIELDGLLSKSGHVRIKHYKTKGPNTREIIAYTDKNIRLYFDSSAGVSSQVNYLNAFLEQGIENDKIDNLRFIYLKSDNKIFFK